MGIVSRPVDITEHQFSSSARAHTATLKNSLLVSIKQSVRWAAARHTNSSSPQNTLLTGSLGHAMLPERCAASAAILSVATSLPIASTIKPTAIAASGSSQG